MMTNESTTDKASSLSSSVFELRAYVLDAVHKGLSLHDFETGLWDRTLRMGRAAFEEFLQLQGNGDLGPTLDLPDGRQLNRLEGLHQRPLTGVFGHFKLSRVCYGTREGQKVHFVPLDNRLQLPQGKLSYLLQDFDSLLETQMPYQRVAHSLHRILRFKQHPDTLHRNAQHLAAFAEPFTEQLPSPGIDEMPILVRSADAKGVPMRLDDAPPIQSHAHTTGPKPGRKKQAIVGAVYSVERLVRSPEEVVEELFRDPTEPKPERPERPEPFNKRVLAVLNEYTDEEGAEHDGMAEVFGWLRDETEERNFSGEKEIVNLCDGDERLWDGVEGISRVGEVDVVDLLHVLQRLWLVAGLFWAVGSEGAVAQVRKWTLWVLRGKGRVVIRQMRGMGTRAKLSGSKSKTLELACNYLEKRLEQMRYDEYLSKGYPIASGVIEGACRHYVKDRMEGTGMSWSQDGAQTMLKLRSVNLNGDWDDFHDFYRLRQTQHLYPHRQLLDSLTWTLAC